MEKEKRAREEVEKEVTIVSDVDAHSQCKMRVSVKGGRVIEIRGDPTDPESKGELTLRGKQMMEILYALDRLKYPMFFGLTGLIAGCATASPKIASQLEKTRQSFRISNIKKSGSYPK
ncbi:MAG: hypothetical protein N2V78_12120 [Methanophagales archaeon]|nr:hypothetical protein [Methanophagales archaeon]